ncbi:glycosyltransferase [Micromonospora sp. U21]|uniref:glycosyltransferase family 2 protein n=1 Tax=Micromonospora sp. U21 TaxID=2824899 RepID=UPI001B365800|nr:glycosyltransferase [Micromonospora sp. U21]MBQ0900516.1 glycosyltransferase [Micromonospora sp. U21]
MRDPAGSPAPSGYGPRLSNIDAPTEPMMPAVMSPNLSATPNIDAPTLPSMRAVEPVTPAFSVCIAVRDRPQLLVKSIQSVLAGSFGDFEIVVVDDGSAVPVREGLAEARLLDDRRIRVVRQQPTGISAARNAALRVARGRFVTVLDSDDELSPDGLARIHGFLARTGARWVYTDYEERVGGSAKVIRLPSYPTPRRMLWSVLTRPRLPFKHSGMSIDRQLLVQLGGYDERMPIKVDVELVLRALSNGVHLQRLDHPVVVFHRHGGSISRRRLAGLAAWHRMIRRYSRPRVPGLALTVVGVRAVSELGKWLVTAIGK